MSMVRTLGLGAGLFFAVATAAMANDVSLPAYGNVGHQNTAAYVFTAQSSGDLESYFTGSTATDTEILGVLVNGVEEGTISLANHGTPLGYEWNFGPSLSQPVVVATGDTITFFINDENPTRDIVPGHDNIFYSNANMNSYNNQPVQHIFSAAFGGGTISAGGQSAFVPAGTYVGFEDLPANVADWNYNDETFVFNIVAPTTSLGPTGSQNSPGGIPEPATWGLMLVGFGGLGALLRRARAKGLATA
ncbi:PEPxxWA-CTERM sorting domain-containing protein [Phenylobacterium sp.]|uniref:PEPxxWA-CTERM sorting domain-containing protein n=1 Tax=Phenylobacterium sp. TaxID=1871053 RepID=UPI001201FF6E|nr:PEPxxWA-CTERM sorting domain-containing protein [Phenylobacterium sp.]THD70644.1 MAG: DUF4114 domain-containing protein [Phenylobacterium sp.]